MAERAGQTRPTVSSLRAAYPGLAVLVGGDLNQAVTGSLTGSKDGRDHRCDDLRLSGSAPGCTVLGDIAGPCHPRQQRPGFGPTLGSFGPRQAVLRDGSRSQDRQDRVRLDLTSDLSWQRRSAEALGVGELLVAVGLVVDDPTPQAGSQLADAERLCGPSACQDRSLVKSRRTRVLDGLGFGKPVLEVQPAWARRMPRVRPDPGRCCRGWHGPAMSPPRLCKPGSGS